MNTFSRQIQITHCLFISNTSSSNKISYVELMGWIWCSLLLHKGIKHPIDIKKKTNQQAIFHTKHYCLVILVNLQQSWKRHSKSVIACKWQKHLASVFYLSFSVSLEISRGTQGAVRWVLRFITKKIFKSASKPWISPLSVQEFP